MTDSDLPEIGFLSLNEAPHHLLWYPLHLQMGRVREGGWAWLCTSISFGRPDTKVPRLIKSLPIKYQIKLLLTHRKRAM
jgi:hypothetical protein